MELRKWYDKVIRSNVWVVCIFAGIELLDYLKIIYERNHAKAGDPKKESTTGEVYEEWEVLTDEQRNQLVILSGDMLNGGSWTGGNPDNVKYGVGVHGVGGKAEGTRHSIFQDYYAQVAPGMSIPEFDTWKICGTKQNQVCSSMPDTQFKGWKEPTDREYLRCNSYTPYAYDAMILYAAVFDRMLTNNPKNWRDFTHEDYYNGMREFIKPDDPTADSNGFECLSASFIEFDKNQDVGGAFEIRTFVPGNTAGQRVLYWGSSGMTREIDANGDPVDFTFHGGGTGITVKDRNAPNLPTGTGSVQQKCPVGQYTSINGAESECKPCEMGHYQDEIGQVYCKECEVGSYAGTTGRVGVSLIVKFLYIVGWRCWRSRV